MRQNMQTAYPTKKGIGFEWPSANAPSGLKTVARCAASKRRKRWAHTCRQGRLGCADRPDGLNWSWKYACIFRSLLNDNKFSRQSKHALSKFYCRGGSHEKQRFGTIFLSAPNPPLQNEHDIFIVVSPSLIYQKIAPKEITACKCKSIV